MLHFLALSLVVSIDPNNVTAKVFGIITFVCYTNGSGELSFVWEHDGIIISTSNSTLQQNSLHIDSVLPQHQGQYKCTVTPSHSKMSYEAFTTLNVNGKVIYSAIQFAVLLIHLLIIFLAPSFDSKTVLQQITSNASANTITVYIPHVDDSDGPVRYGIIVCAATRMY